jgi:hypothetical protein
MRGTTLHALGTIVLATAVAGSRGPAAQASQAKPVDDPDAYAVYASVLASGQPAGTAHAVQLVFQEETVTNRGCMPSGTPLETSWRSVVDNFRAANARVSLVRAGYPLGVPYIVVPSADINATLHEIPNDPSFGWTGFYNRYPDSGGFMTVSAVGFDASRTRAMVYMAISCGSLCGNGEHHLLEKAGGLWREAKLPGLKLCKSES